MTLSGERVCFGLCQLALLLCYSPSQEGNIQSERGPPGSPSTGAHEEGVVKKVRRARRASPRTFHLRSGHATIGVLVPFVTLSSERYTVMLEISMNQKRSGVFRKTKGQAFQKFKRSSQTSREPCLYVTSSEKVQFRHSLFSK